MQNFLSPIKYIDQASLLQLKIEQHMKRSYSNKNEVLNYERPSQKNSLIKTMSLNQKMEDINEFKTQNQNQFEEINKKIDNQNKLINSLVSQQEQVNQQVQNQNFKNIESRLYNTVNLIIDQKIQTVQNQVQDSLYQFQQQISQQFSNYQNQIQNYLNQSQSSQIQNQFQNDLNTLQQQIQLIQQNSQNNQLDINVSLKKIQTDIMYQQQQLIDGFQNLRQEFRLNQEDSLKMSDFQYQDKKEILNDSMKFSLDLQHQQNIKKDFFSQSIKLENIELSSQSGSIIETNEKFLSDLIKTSPQKDYKNYIKKYEVFSQEVQDFLKNSKLKYSTEISSGFQSQLIELNLDQEETDDIDFKLQQINQINQNEINKAHQLFLKQNLLQMSVISEVSNDDSQILEFIKEQEKYKQNSLDLKENKFFNQFNQQK